MAEVHGTCDPKFAELRDILNGSLDAGADLGASVSVVLDDQCVVDLWGGWADDAHTRRWTADTITNVWSTTKTMVALSALLMIERGALDPFEPVATYWPEFAANGKDGIEIRHLMAHTSGVPAWEQPVSNEVMYDWDESVARLAAQAPWWTPGEGSGYHALNYGHLIGEVIRRVDGRGLKQFVAEELAGAFGADFQIGLRDADLGRVSDVIPPPPLPIDLATIDLAANPVAIKALTGPMIDANAANTAGWRRATIGGANGHSNAKAVARIQSVVGNDGVIDGRKVLSRDTIDLIFSEQAHGPDQVLFIPLRWGIGYGLPETTTLPYLPDEDGICFWGGYGGSMIVMDRNRKLTIAYMMNKMEPGIIGGVRARAILESVFGALA